MRHASTDGWPRCGWSRRARSRRSCATPVMSRSTVGTRSRPPRSGSAIASRHTIAERERDVEVVEVIEARVGAPVALTCYIDHSPPPPVDTLPPGMEWTRHAGRPSKRLRRELDRLRRGGDSS